MFSRFSVGFLGFLGFPSFLGFLGFLVFLGFLGFHLGTLFLGPRGPLIEPSIPVRPPARAKNPDHLYSHINHCRTTVNVSKEKRGKREKGKRRKREKEKKGKRGKEKK